MVWSYYPFEDRLRRTNRFNDDDETEEFKEWYGIYE
jgi:hypothetical protein